MTERQKKFSEHYAANPNATEAAVQAGYSDRTAYSIGQRLLSNPEVAGYLRQLQQEARSSRIANAAEAKELLTGILRDQSARNSDRIMSAKTLLRCSGEVVPERRVDDDGDSIPAAPIDHICLPVLEGSADATAIESPDGEILPFVGHEADEILTYIPFSVEAIEDYLTAAAQRQQEAENED